MTDTITHLPGCNLPHEGGNQRWTCRQRLVVTQPGLGTAAKPEEIATVTVDADGPCSDHGAALAVWVEFTAFDDTNLAQIFSEVQQAVDQLRPVRDQWEQASRCHHPEDQPCIEYE